ncbi:hypothetical protein PIB30_060096 [Stylosanthes scabra]|uniref:Uncharacterized protein n=1 Tax=Stylosanthes scabra TaxID=79078 RepID=A0ABU6QJW7_9FABA|nr:hypothetical protein [Stylosanthes scabra]
MIQSANSNFNNSSIASQPLNFGDLPSQPLSNPRNSIPTLFRCANQEMRQDALLHEEDVESLNHEDVHECLEEVEEENEDQEVEDVNQEVEDKHKKPNGMEIVHSASPEATSPKLPSELHFEWVITCGESKFKAYSGHLHKLHNNRAKVRSLSMRKNLGPWQFQEKLVNPQNNGGLTKFGIPEKVTRINTFGDFIGALRSLVHATWDPRDHCNYKDCWKFQDEFKHKPP